MGSNRSDVLALGTRRAPADRSASRFFNEGRYTTGTSSYTGTGSCSDRTSASRRRYRSSLDRVATASRGANNACGCSSACDWVSAVGVAAPWCAHGRQPSFPRVGEPSGRRVGPCAREWTPARPCGSCLSECCPSHVGDQTSPVASSQP